MVTFEELRDLIDRRTFEPFALSLDDGNIVKITENGSTLVTRSEFLYTLDFNRMKYIPLKRIKSAYKINETSGTGGGGVA
jgi:hypothetical protein